MDNQSLRMRFSKTGAIKYISHLDLTRVFLRALRRSDIRLKYSEGYTPHPKFAFGVPLSVGTESVCEVCDFTLADDMDVITPEEVMSRLAGQLPAGIEILSCAPAVGKLREITYCDYLLTFDNAREDIIPLMRKSLEGRLVVMKRMKKGGEKELDITDMIVLSDIFCRDGKVCMSLRLPCGNDLYLNPEYVVAAMRQNSALEKALEEYSTLRTKLFYADFTEFRY